MSKPQPHPDQCKHPGCYAVGTPTRYKRPAWSKPKALCATHYQAYTDRFSDLQEVHR